MTALYSHPSIVSWVPFNEAWGQFDTKRIVDFTKELDSQVIGADGARISGGRLIN